MWGAPGQKNVAWGDFAHFVQYTAQVNSFLPGSFATALAWLATAAETIIGILLIVGVWPVYVAAASGALFAIFRIAMAISFGIKSPLDFSVFAASAAGLVLALFEKSRMKRGELMRLASGGWVSGIGFAPGSEAR